VPVSFKPFQRSSGFFRESDYYFRTYNARVFAHGMTATYRARAAIRFWRASCCPRKFEKDNFVMLADNNIIFFTTKSTGLSQLLRDNINSIYKTRYVAFTS
jgi:hypothetical protein